MKRADVIELFSRLRELNPHPTTELVYSTPFELLVAVVLSAQATDVSVNKATKKEMKKILTEIQTGKFTRQWVNEYKGGLKKYNALLKKGEKHQIEKTGLYLRTMMPWMTKKNIKGVQASYA